MKDMLKKGIYVSCQPSSKDEYFYDYHFIKRFVLAAEYGGASAIGIEGVKNVKKILSISRLPVISLKKKNKINSYDKRNITPNIGDAYELYNNGARIIAIDFTFREGCDKNYYKDLVVKLRGNCKDIEIYADISTIEEAINAQELKVNYISSTLTGYTDLTKGKTIPNFNILEEMQKYIKIPYIFEGGVSTNEHIVLSKKYGVFGIVIGSAITRPNIITKNFVDKFIGENNE
jgi:N-acylglucosamine-6-phosphate 2-epimerase